MRDLVLRIGRHLPWVVQIYGSQVMFIFAALLLITAAVWREIAVDKDGAIGRGRVSRVLLVAIAISVILALGLTAFRLFSQALDP